MASSRNARIQGLQSNALNRYRVASTDRNLARNRLMILLIAMISILPFGFAWYLAKHTEMIKNQPKANYGHLITPARPIDYAELLQTPISAAETLPEIKGHWIMLQVASGPVCNETCKATAGKTVRMRLMLNKELSRVRRLLLVPGEADAASMKEIAEHDPTLLVAGLSDGLRQRLEEAVGAPLSEGGLILLDPFANVMMWYEPGFDPYGVLRDLKRLLRNSQIG